MWKFIIYIFVAGFYLTPVRGALFEILTTRADFKHFNVRCDGRWVDSTKILVLVADFLFSATF